MDKTSNDHLDALVRGDQKGIREIYQQYLPRINRLITSNGGNGEDAKDVFQEALMVVYEKATGPDFRLTSSLYTLLYGVCRNIWGNRLQRKSRTEVTFGDHDKYKLSESLEEAIEQEEEHTVFWEAFERLGDDCQRLLRLFFDKIKMEEIAEVMGYGSTSYAKKRKFQCKEQLVSLVKSDNRFRELRP
ncbi:MAG: sigma-70 family RNA polymerase sigma factor [Phaeodactylibacter sp.]|nr:sigma-70 family RNA polymerase sigma factor [Phaeodactylibacter sp.]MCB9301941.1 sigma-70 family RNA polymerase sigma factor [Lewinellaceae bacterium]HQU59799.1 sigma-70 family RNA polymerase sigma factor [Saprospiraceae bacterium]